MRAFLPFNPPLYSYPCFAVPQACFEQRSPAEHPLASMKHWSYEIMTSHVSSEKVGRCLLHTLYLGLPHVGLHQRVPLIH